MKGVLKNVDCSESQILSLASHNEGAIRCSPRQLVKTVCMRAAAHAGLGKAT